MKRTIFIVLLSGAFSIGAISAVAAETNLKEIKAYINNSLKIKVDGKQFVPTDSEGNQLNPIVYEGNSYLPVRSLSQALNVSVNYDQSTSTITLGDGQVEGDKLVQMRAGESNTVITSRDPDILSIHNEHVVEGFYTVKPHDILPSTITFRLYAKYRKLSFRVGAIGSPATIIVSDQKNKVELKKFTIMESDKFKSLEIANIGDVDYLDIKIYGTTDKNRVNFTTEKVVITDALVH
ncbi:stalk domain-containing protein [Paenibacillus filicis]|uniref:Stalk domain-containing protein n=1 Tax=Paenibacillus gyeongsangnamensis TaxID=3388067 RepID=A0ABT4QH76_9BACL|nr:stalk domain-containing protein [Paenibacillus filicis]MCZ8516142.1 stalk domain-containing protein [Paenibacillus filicis]